MNRYLKGLLLTIGLFFISFFMTGCHSSKKAVGVSNNKKIPKTEVVNVKSLKGLERKIVEEALTWQGTPYKYGGSEKGRGTDCSGLVTKVYLDVANKKLPRNSAQQAEFCKKLKAKEVKPGDLVFFATGKSKDKVSHVGIMIDDHRFVHASAQKGVLISDVETPYYQRTFIMFGRVP